MEIPTWMGVGGRNNEEAAGGEGLAHVPSPARSVGLAALSPGNPGVNPRKG